MWFVKGRRAQNDEDYETWLTQGIVPTLNAFDNATETRATVLILDGTRVDDVRVYDDEIMQTVIQRWVTGGGNVPAIQKSDDLSVRRLTPMECKRLQGFPDGWTEGQADSNRYRQMGNAVAVPVVQWIIDNVVGERNE